MLIAFQLISKRTPKLFSNLASANFETDRNNFTYIYLSTSILLSVHVK